MSDMKPGAVSSDGRWAWDGSQWVPRSAPPQTTSPDGLWVWDGSRWQPAAGGTGGVACEGAGGEDRLHT